MRRSVRYGTVATGGLALLLGTLAISPTALAQDRERASIVFGAFITDRKTTTRVDSATMPGTDLRLEEDLGLEDSSTVLRMNGHLWLKPRHRFDVSLFDLSRSASRRIDETIEFGDETFVIDSVINSSQDLSILKADYTFSVVDKPRGFLGLTGGLYVARTKLALTDPELGISEVEDLTAPLPVAGFRGEFEVTERITVGGASQWFSIDVDDASGSLRDFYIGADYRVGRRFAVGLAYNEVRMNINAEEVGGYTGSIDWGYDGWLLYFGTDFGR
jgi:hypothetical protein